MALLCVGFIASPIASAQSQEYLLKVEVQTEKGETIQVTTPINLLSTLYAFLPEQVKEQCNEMRLTPDTLINELKTLEGEDLVKVTGKDSVRIYLAPVTSNNQRELGFIRVLFKENKEGGNEMRICIPRGLIQLAGEVIKHIGVLDHMTIPTVQHSQ